MSIIISKFSAFSEAYSTKYFQKLSEQHKLISEEFNNFENDKFVGFFAENHSFVASIVFNPNNNIFVYNLKDKYNDTKMPNYSEAKVEIKDFLNNVEKELFSSNDRKNNLLPFDDYDKLNLVYNAIQNCNCIVYFEDLTKLDYNNHKDFVIDYESTKESVENLFYNPNYSENKKKLSFGSIKTLFNDISTKTGTIKETQEVVYSGILNEYLNTQQQDNFQKQNNDNNYDNNMEYFRTMNY